MSSQVTTLATKLPRSQPGWRGSKVITHLMPVISHHSGRRANRVANKASILSVMGRHPQLDGANLDNVIGLELLALPRIDAAAVQVSAV